MWALDTFLSTMNNNNKILKLWAIITDNQSSVSILSGKYIVGQKYSQENVMSNVWVSTVG